MRIDRLEVTNFKKLAQERFDFHPRFTLVVGQNGSGKSSILDALAVAAGIWLVDPPDSALARSRRDIAEDEIRLEGHTRGDRLHFREKLPVEIRAWGQLGDAQDVFWMRRILDRG